MDIVLPLVMYIVFSYASGKIGEKFHVGSMGQYFIPIYSQLLLCKCAQISLWWVLGMFVPIVNLAVIVYIYGTLAQRLGKSFWVNGLGSLIFCITVFIMAWDDSKPVNALPPAPPTVTRV
ncbi:DUF5684 domain-containing protein [Sporomusa malonica]|uniref:Uncharacterized protein n=1 Tax=Sporomusa malonica TaxID=112901 RepID=A0A1W2E3T4_9FIRM|nr:DUF5684 domain-containing protein [Sporomusa malonica]SMD04433.1 hypothetical protein SAMN04488500_12051 [Sporomusa malonica]